MDIKELLDQFTLFDPVKGQRAELPAVKGNYIVVLKAGCNIPDVLVISNIRKSFCTEWIIVCCIQV